VAAKLLVVTRSRALSHVLVMYQAQYDPDAEVDKPHRCQKYRQFAAFSDLEHVQIHSDQHQAKADEHPGSNNLNSHFPSVCKQSSRMMDLSTIANCVGCYYRNHEKNGNEYRNGPGIFDEKFDELGHDVTFILLTNSTRAFSADSRGH
jgi:hypothetical protein